MLGNRESQTKTKAVAKQVDAKANTSKTIGSLKKILDACVIPKAKPGQQADPAKPINMTEFGKYSKRSFSVPLEKMEDLMAHYYREIIAENKTDNLIQRQLIGKSGGEGCILIDVDFRFSADKTSRYYTSQHLIEFQHMYLEALHETFEMDEDTVIGFAIMEKPSPRVDVKETGNILKDGFHGLINLSVSREAQLHLRELVIQKMTERWAEFPIVNQGGWDDVLDDSIPKGTNGFLLPNSKKADETSHYVLTTYTNVQYNTDEDCWETEDVIPHKCEDIVQRRAVFMKENYRIFFPLYNDRPTLLLQESVIPELKKHTNANVCLPGVANAMNNGLSIIVGGNGPITLQSGESATAASGSVVNNNGIMAQQMITEMDQGIPMGTLMTIRSMEELDAAVALLMESLSYREHDIRESFGFVMLLPDTYYGSGSYNKWVKVGFALHNISRKLLPVWIKFSSQSPSFTFDNIPEMCSMWAGFLTRKDKGGLTKRSIMYWARQENPEEYKKVEEGSIESFIDLVIDSTNVSAIAAKSGKGGNAGCTDNALAHVLYIMYKNTFVWSGMDFYQFRGHCWHKIEQAIHLRKCISGGMRDTFYNKAMKIFTEAQQYEPDTNEHKAFMLRAQKVMDISLRLGSCSDKDKILKESKEYFYDEDFIRKLNKNGKLLCVRNGVLDFEAGVFRKGSPDDYLSICSNIVYNEYEEDRDGEIRLKIEAYMNRLFPIPELAAYVWEHLASLLIGLDEHRQFLHYYTGIGRNGKSMLVAFMEMILGDYACALDANFYTTERPKRGQSTPELVAIIGKRLAVTSEPEESEKMYAGPMKQLTSGTDKITCRALYGQMMEFVNQANPVILANYYLKIHSRDLGTWRRVRVIPFLSIFTENPVNDDPDSPYQFPLDPDISKNFEEWKEVMLALLVEIAFRTKGVVHMCNTVKNASEEYQRGQDYLMEFIDAKLIKGNKGTHFITKSVLSSEFTKWYLDNYHTRTNKSKDLFTKMDQLFGQCKNLTKTTQGWTGVSLKHEASTVEIQEGMSTGSSGEGVANEEEGTESVREQAEDDAIDGLGDD
jgi:P4 family phage/plasmid primase-like protien